MISNEYKDVVISNDISVFPRLFLRGGPPSGFFFYHQSDITRSTTFYYDNWYNLNTLYPATALIYLVGEKFWGEH